MEIISLISFLTSIKANGLHVVASGSEVVINWESISLVAVYMNGYDNPETSILGCNPTSANIGAARMGQERDWKSKLLYKMLDLNNYNTPFWHFVGLVGQLHKGNPLYIEV